VKRRLDVQHLLLNVLEAEGGITLHFLESMVENTAIGIRKNEGKEA
jgi:hypothetical protein